MIGKAISGAKGREVIVAHVATQAEFDRDARSSFDLVLGGRVIDWLEESGEVVFDGDGDCYNIGFQRPMSCLLGKVNRAEIPNVWLDIYCWLFLCQGYGWFWRLYMEQHRIYSRILLTQLCRHGFLLIQ